MRCDDADVMMMPKKKNKQNLIWGKPPGITTDTTNKGPRPEIHATVRARVLLAAPAPCAGAHRRDLSRLGILAPPGLCLTYTG